MVILVVTKGEVVRANMYVYLKVQLMLRTDFIIVYVNQRKPFWMQCQQKESRRNMNVVGN